MIPALIAFSLGLLYGRWWALLLTAGYMIGGFMLTDFIGHAGIFGPLPPMPDWGNRIESLALAAVLTTFGILINKGFRKSRNVRREG